MLPLGSSLAEFLTLSLCHWLAVSGSPQPALWRCLGSGWGLESAGGGGKKKERKESGGAEEAGGGDRTHLKKERSSREGQQHRGAESDRGGGGGGGREERGWSHLEPLVHTVQRSWGKVNSRGRIPVCLRPLAGLAGGCEDECAGAASVIKTD